ncbi:MAG: hypothetical protein WCE96_04110, partial [Nitrososphaeraceae archaeon]
LTLFMTSLKCGKPYKASAKINHSPTAMTEAAETNNKILLRIIIYAHTFIYKEWIMIFAENW